MRSASLPPLPSLCLLLVGSVGANGCGDDDDDPEATVCDAAALTAALEAATAGEVVTIGACTIDGTFTVPAGVELRGAGAASSTLRTDVGTAVDLEAGTGTTRLAALTVTSEGDAAVLARGTGTGAIELVGIEVRVERGIGIGVEAVSSLVADGAVLTGPVDSSNADDFEQPWVPDEVATVGLGVFGVPQVTISSSSVTGFASAAAAFVDSGTTWSGGGVRENLGVGIFVSGGTADLTSLEVARTLSGTGLYPAYGIVCAGGGAMATTLVAVSETEGHGVLHDDCDAEHVDLVSEANERAGVWAQNGGMFRLTGSGSSIAGNGFAGIWLARIDTVEVDGARIADTNLVPTIPDTDASPVDMGDGLQIRDTPGPVTLSNLTVTNNGRAGILIDLGGGSSAGYSFEAVTVDGTGEQFGCVGQNGDLLDGWAAGVERLGATAVNDAARVDPLGVRGVIEPEDLPPAASDLDLLLQ